MVQNVVLNGLSILPMHPIWGGIWERMIPVIRRVLRAVLGNCHLNDEILSTVFAEVESIINSGPSLN